jgi:hypothetical protein
MMVVGNYGVVERNIVKGQRNFGCKISGTCHSLRERKNRVRV